jgi:hypothetical protein
MSAALSITPEEVQAEPIVGWRIWRVIEADTVDGAKAVRLAAAGTRGLPPLWPPLQPIVAVCSKFDSRHEAPWPSHQCGVYALRTRRLAEEILSTFVAAENGDKVEAWAIGRVSLWGRVVECEHGWRGQYAYPYALTVLTEDESLTRRLGAVYAVDVDTAPPLPAVETSPDDEPEALKAAPDAKLAALKTEIAAIRAGLGEPTKRIREKAPPLPEPPPLNTDVTRDDVLTAFYLHAARCLIESPSSREWALSPRRRNIVQADELTLVLLWHRGYRHAAMWKARDFPAEQEAAHTVALAIASELRQMRREGLVESGMVRTYSQQTYFRLTEAGLASVASLPRLPARLRLLHQKAYWSETIVKTPRLTRSRVLDYLRLPPALFTAEVEALKPQLVAERAAAQAKGDRTFRRYLAGVRAGDDFGEVRIYYTEEETLDALRQAFVSHGRQPVSFQQLMAVLGPGAYGQEEAARVSVMLVRLRQARKAKTVAPARNPNARLWQPALLNV